ncbi:TIGR01212 family radical SAM protein [Lagierella sp.]|uniref:TIGR01212 family radical SAM protein n=1 Tax=Lagierella sp. TaxID=2849657 RepID=UPI00261859AF|nr:TIGR01212 family radical SAM protein [Lagierella sp.]
MERYNSLSSYLKNRFGEKILKVSIDGGFTCPNRLNGNRGCIFCGEDGAGEFSGSRKLSITEQIDSQIKFLEHKSKSSKYMAYFQSFTNTFASPETLKSKYYEALNHPNILGISVATRPDCIDDNVLEILEEISKSHELWVELGFQSSKQSTVKLINRGYENHVFQRAVMSLHKKGIKTVAHIIFGLPNESHENWMDTVRFVNSLPVWGIKFHSLYIYKDSLIYDYYLNNRFKILQRDEYIDGVCDAIAILSKDIVIHRLTGDPDKKKLFLPKWPVDKIRVIGTINKKLKERNIFQGAKP